MCGARNKPRPGHEQTRMVDRTNKERSQNKPKGNPEQTRMARRTNTNLFGPDFWFVRSTDPYCSETDPYCSNKDQICSLFVNLMLTTYKISKKTGNASLNANPCFLYKINKFKDFDVFSYFAFF